MFVIKMNGKSDIPYYYAENGNVNGWVRDKAMATAFHNKTDIKRIADEWWLEENDYVIEEK